MSLDDKPDSKASRERRDILPESARLVAGLRKQLSRYSLLAVLVVLVVVFSVILPGTFPTTANLRVITATQSVLIFTTLGLTFALNAGEFDVSFGSVVGWSSSLFAVLLVNQHWPGPLAVLGVLVSAVVIGLVNAFFVVYLNINSLIVTLGSGTVILGLTLAVTSSQVIVGGPEWLTAATTNQLLGLPYPVYASLLLAQIVWYVYERTPFGRYIYFVGAGREVARLAGLPVSRIRILSFVIVAVLSSIGGMISFGNLGSADPNIGASFLLPAFAAAFLGSTAIKPGRINSWGTVIAVYVLVVGVTGIELAGGAGYWEQIFNGSILVLAVAIPQAIRRIRQPRWGRR